MFNFLSKYFGSRGPLSFLNDDPPEEWPGEFRPLSADSIPPIPDRVNRRIEELIKAHEASNPQATHGNGQDREEDSAEPIQLWPGAVGLKRRPIPLLMAATLLVVLGAGIALSPWWGDREHDGRGEITRATLIFSRDTFLVRAGVPPAHPAIQERVRTGDLLRTGSGGHAKLDLGGSVVELHPLTLVRFEREKSGELAIHLVQGELFYASTRREHRSPVFLKEGWAFHPTGTAARLQSIGDQVDLQVGEGSFRVSPVEEDPNPKGDHSGMGNVQKEPVAHVPSGNGLILTLGAGAGEKDRLQFYALAKSTRNRLESTLQRIRLSPADYGEVGPPPYDQVLLKDGTTLTGRMLYEGGTYIMVTPSGNISVPGKKIGEIRLSE